jgi:hypothetical protein
MSAGDEVRRRQENDDRDRETEEDNGPHLVADH